jgi:DNA-directed RNA polymerase II subunit RPB1
MSIYRELDYTPKIRSIIRVEFGILSPEEIIKRSVTHVHKTTLYENNGEPTTGGLFDPRMGVIDRGKLCKTCHLDRTFCPGHAGHIELVKPVFQFQYMYIVLRLLKSVCLFCNKALIDINNPLVKSIIKNCGEDHQQLFMEMTELASKRKICGRESDSDIMGNPKGCGMIQPSKYQKVEFKIFAEWKVGKGDKKDKEERKINLTPEMLIHLFAEIPREDCYAFGFSENWCLPHWLITNVLPVSPPAVRPSVRQYNNQRMEDDLTQKYIDIIKYNNILKKKLHSGSSKDTIGYYFMCLQFHVATLIDNESQSKTAVTRASNRPLRTYKQRLHSKEGRVRGNLMGKRVDFSARSVITPDPNISIDQLGVPLKIATNLSFPEKVNQFNYHKLYKLVLNGANNYPGVKKIKKKTDGKTFTLEFHTPATLKETADNLEEGDIVHRHLMDGDPVLFNRQPSLHKMSMMAHKVVVMDHSTFRLNVTVTTPYNADFDKHHCRKQGELKACNSLVLIF